MNELQLLKFIADGVLSIAILIAITGLVIIVELDLIRKGQKK